QATIVCLCRLTVRASDIAQTDEFPLFMRYFRLHCLDTSEHVNYEKLLNWQDMITKSKEGQLLTVEERDYLQEIVRIGLYNHRLKSVCLTACEDSRVGESEGPNNYSLL
ncbi:TPA: hypothetical protein N6027_005228, partial [Escherichia coli]|nr:hypothetical protein [Escherichia coli]